jgi:hypothetical protein
MKTFQHYLAESQRTYDYRIKVVGDINDGFFSELETKLSQFDIAKMSKPKTTPVMTTLKDFPNEKNQTVTSVDVSFRYPAIEPQIQQLAQIMGVNPTRVRMLDMKYDNSMDKEIESIKSENQDLLSDTDYPSNTEQQNELKRDYSAEPHDHAVLKNSYRSDFTVAGGKTPSAETTNSLPQGTVSPISNIKRPPKPATGAQPKG